VSRLTGFLGLVLATLLALHGCDHPYTQIIVSVDSDLPAPKVLKSVKILVQKISGGAGAPVEREGTVSDIQLPTSLALTSPDGRETQILVTVQGFGLDAAKPFITRAARVRFKHDKTLLLRMDLLSSCAGVACAEDTSCGEQECQPIDPGSLPAYMGPPDKLATDDGGPRDAGTPDSGHADAGSARDPEQVVDLALGVDHTCALKASGSVYCWGSNAHYALGRSIETDATCPESALCRTPGVVHNLHKAVAIGAGQGFTCALDEFNAVYCWGINDHGQMGARPEDQRDQSTPIKLADDIRELRVGRHFACVVRNDQTVSCWGDNEQNQLAQPSTLVTGTRLTEAIESSVTSLALGSQSACALRAKGDIQCWGDNSMRQLGAIKPSHIEMPVMFPQANVTELALGDGHICMLVSGKDHFVYCAGRADNDQLGLISAVPGQICYDADVPNGNPNQVVCTEKLVQLDLGAKVYSLATGARFTCARVGDEGPDMASVMCWGKNDSKQVDRSGNNSVDMPTAVPVTAGVTLIRAGERHACAVEGPRLWCWGANEAGQLGPDTKEATSAPVKIKLPKDG
jgi:alpha-tubulin suppressor-like RCC1 family protein